jgi:hypothetical protein
MKPQNQFSETLITILGTMAIVPNNGYNQYLLCTH